MEASITIKMDASKKEDLQRISAIRGLNLSGFVRMVLYGEIQKSTATVEDK